MTMMFKGVCVCVCLQVLSVFEEITLRSILDQIREKHNLQRASKVRNTHTHSQSQTLWPAVLLTLKVWEVNCGIALSENRLLEHSPTPPSLLVWPRLILTLITEADQTCGLWQFLWSSRAVSVHTPAQGTHSIHTHYWFWICFGFASFLLSFTKCLLNCNRVTERNRWTNRDSVTCI